MSNTNCLEGIRCPQCGQEDRFLIIGGAQFDVTDEGSEAAGDHEWGDDSPTRCPECGREGKLAEFHAPPDPDGQNADRSAWAEYALTAFESQTGSDREASLGDLLTNLMHWCDGNGQDFGLALDRARGHYAAEIGGKA